MSDIYWDDVWALCHFDGTDGSTSIVDEATPEIPWTAANQTSISTTESVFGGSSLKLDGSGDYAYKGVAADAAWLHNGSTDYTLEFRAYRNAASFDTFLDTGGGPTSDYGVYGRFNSDGSILFVVAKGATGSYAVSVTAPAGSAPVGSWFAVAIEVLPNVSATIYIDGVSVATAVFANPTGTGSNSKPFRMGYYQQAGGYDWAGYMDELRVTKVARYLGDYTVATEPFSNSAPVVPITNLELEEIDPYIGLVAAHLTFENGFDDEIGTVWTPTGSAVVNTTTPVYGTGSLDLPAPTAGRLRSAAVPAPADATGGDFCVEITIDGIIARNPTQAIWDARAAASTAGYVLYLYYGDPWLKLNNGAATIAVFNHVIIADGLRHEVVIQRENGLLYCWIDGIAWPSNGTLATAEPFPNATGEFVLGDNYLTTISQPYYGLIDEFRVTYAARYDGAYTPPLAPYSTEAASFDLLLEDGTLLLDLENTGSVPTALYFSVQPLDVSTTQGLVAQFTATAAGGTLPYAYQWYNALTDAPLVEGVDGTGVDTDTLSITTAATDDGNTYYSIVTDSE